MLSCLCPPLLYSFQHSCFPICFHCTIACSRFSLCISKTSKSNLNNLAWTWSRPLFYCCLAHMFQRIYSTFLCSCFSFIQTLVVSTPPPWPECQGYGGETERSAHYGGRSTAHSAEGPWGTTQYSPLQLLDSTRYSPLQPRPRLCLPLPCTVGLHIWWIRASGWGSPRDVAPLEAPLGMGFPSGWGSPRDGAPLGMGLPSGWVNVCVGIWAWRAARSMRFTFVTEFVHSCTRTRASCCGLATG